MVVENLMVVVDLIERLDSVDDAISLKKEEQRGNALVSYTTKGIVPSEYQHRHITQQSTSHNARRRQRDVRS
jgi:hypothetical protein